MKLINNLPKLMLLGVSILFYTSTYTQIENLDKKHFLKIYLSQINYMPLEIYANGDKLLESKIVPSAELGIVYSKYLKNKWGWQVGTSYSHVGFNISFDFHDYTPAPAHIEYKDIYNHYFFNEYTYFIPRIATNFSIFKDFVIAKNNLLHIQTGLNLNFTRQIEFSMSHSKTDINGNITNTFLKLKLLSNASTIRGYFSPLLKIGIINKLKNNNFLTINIVGSYASEYIYNGHFIFNTTNWNSKGIIKLKPSYFGIELNYAFLLGEKNKTKKKLSKKNRKQKTKQKF